MPTPPSEEPRLVVMPRTPAPLQPEEPLSEDGWDDLPTDALNHIAVGDLITAYRAAGVPIRVQVHRG